MGRSDGIRTYILPVLGGVLSLGVVAGPELVAWLARPVVEGVPALSQTGEATTPTGTPRPRVAPDHDTVPGTPEAQAPASPPPSARRLSPTSPPAGTMQVPVTEPATAPAPAAEAPVMPPTAPPPTPRTQPARPTPLDRGRQLAGLFYSGQLDQVWEAFVPAVRAEWGSLAAFRAYRARGAEVYGAEKRTREEHVTRDGAVTYYTRTATFERSPGNDWTLILGLDAEGNVSEFGLVEAGLMPDVRVR